MTQRARRLTRRAIRQVGHGACRGKSDVPALASRTGGDSRGTVRWMSLSADVRAALRLLHYWWPVVMGASIAAVVHRATTRPVDSVGLSLLLCGILAAYSLDRILDSPEHSTGTVRANWLRPVLYAGATVGMVASAVLLPLMPLRTALLVPVLGVLVLVYPRLKALPLLKTILVAAVWTWSLIALPFHDGSWFGWRAWLVPVALPLTLIMASGCLLCNLKDEHADRRAAISSAPVMLGLQGTAVMALVLAMGGAAIALAEQRVGLSIAGLVLGAASMRPDLLARNVVGPLLVDMTLTIPGVLIVLRLV